MAAIRRTLSGKDPAALLASQAQNTSEVLPAADSFEWARETRTSKQQTVVPKEISATVPLRGDVMTFARPTFWRDSMVNNLREFYGVPGGVGYSPFRAGAHELPLKPWMGVREGHGFSPASSVCSATHRPTTAAPTGISYPQTAATSRPRTSQPEVQIIKHVQVDQNTLTEERVAMQKLQTENEELRRMCGELQRVVDNTVQMAQNLSEDSRNVALLAHQLAELRLHGIDGEHGGQDRLMLDDDQLSVESFDGAEAAEQDGLGQRLRGVHKHPPDVLLLEATPSTGKKRTLESLEASKRGGAEGSKRLGKPPTPRGTPLQTPRGSMYTPRDSLRPGTASFSPRLMTPRHLGTPRKPSAPLAVGDGGSQIHPAARESNRPGTGQGQPGTAGAVNSGHAAAGEQIASRPPTASSTASGRIKRQRPVHCGRTYIALYRDSLLSTVEDFSRLVFPKEDAKRDQFLNSIKKQQGGHQKDSKEHFASTDGAPRTRPLSELVDRKSWDGFDWKEPPKDPKAPYDGWPGIRRQVHWEPPRGGGAGHSAPIEWSKIVLNKPGGKVFQAAMPVVGAKARAS